MIADISSTVLLTLVMRNAAVASFRSSLINAFPYDQANPYFRRRTPPARLRAIKSLVSSFAVRYCEAASRIAHNPFTVRQSERKQLVIDILIRDGPDLDCGHRY
jgi:hypothetical protein